MDAWYSVFSMGFGYLSALLILLIVIIAVRKINADRRIWKKTIREKQYVAFAGEMTVLSGGARKIPSGTKIGVPYEGTIGSAVGCDIVLSIRKLHLRSAFFWVDGNHLHLVPIRRDTVLVDGEQVEPGDEAIMSTGARLSVNDIVMELRLYGNGIQSKLEPRDPYVTNARRAQVHKGRERSIGRSGGAQTEKKKRLMKRLDTD